jgi:hypothetical protein
LKQPKTHEFVSIKTISIFNDIFSTVLQLTINFAEYLNSKESHGCSSHPGVQAVEVGDGRGLAVLLKENKV